MAHAVDGEDHQREPDQREAGEPGRRHRLVEEQHAAAELQDRRDVLQQAERGQRHPVGRAGEEQQRHRGRRAGEHQQRGVRRPRRARTSTSPLPEPASRGTPGAGSASTADSTNRPSAAGSAEPLLDQAVRAEADRQRQRDVRQAAVVDGQHGDRRGADADRDPLRRRAAARAARSRRAARTTSGRDEVAERGLDHPVGVDAVDVGGPVDGDQRGGQRDAAERRPAATPARAGTASRAATVSTRPTKTTDQTTRWARISTGPAGCKQLEVDREEAPQNVRSLGRTRSRGESPRSRRYPRRGPRRRWPIRRWVARPCPPRQSLSGTSRLSSQLTTPTSSAPSTALGQKSSTWNGRSNWPGDPAGQHEQQRVDDDGDQAERQDVERAADQLDDRAQDRVDEAEDDRDREQRADLAGDRVGVDRDAVDQPASRSTARTR